MSDDLLNSLVTWGQILALAFAILAAFAGLISGFAGQQLSKRADAKLANVSHQVGTVIGGQWESLTSTQLEDLETRLVALRTTIPANRTSRIAVMYENAFGKDLAGSIALAFNAAGWDAKLGPGGGFESGLKVGRGPIGPQLQKIIWDITGIKDVTPLGAAEPDHGFYFVGVGAKTN